MKINPIVGKVYHAIFNNLSQIELDGEVYTKGPFGNGNNFISRVSKEKIIRGFDIGKFRYMEQNPETPFGSKNAHRKIVWIFCGGEYIGKVDNGIVYHIDGSQTTMVGHI